MSNISMFMKKEIIGTGTNIENKTIEWASLYHIAGVANIKKSIQIKKKNTTRSSGSFGAK